MCRDILGANGITDEYPAMRHAANLAEGKITGTAVDKAGNKATLTVTVNLDTQAPQVNAGPDISAFEGSPFSFSGTVSDNLDDQPVFGWTFGDGATAGQKLNPQHTYLDNNIYTVTLAATDHAGHTHSNSLTVTAQNAPPSVVASGPGTALEGSLVEITATFTDPGILDTHTAAVDWGDGKSSEIGVTEQNGSGSLSASHIYADNGTYTATVRVADKDGGIGEASLQIAVENAAPAISQADSITAKEGDFIALQAAFTDPGFDNPAEGCANNECPTAETFTATIDWGDGTTEPAEGIALTRQTGSDGTPTSGSVSASHAYADNGKYKITVAIADDDGGSATSLIHVRIDNVPPAVVEAAFIRDDEGTFVALETTFTDPGFDNPLSPAGPTQETFTAIINWGDGTTEPVGDIALNRQSGKAGTPTAGTIKAGHAYADNGDYKITFTIADDDEGGGL